MESEIESSSRLCPIIPSHKKDLSSWKYEHQIPWPVVIAAGLIMLLTISTVSTYPFWVYNDSEREYWFDAMLLDVDQDGNLMQTDTYATNIQSAIGFGGNWGRVIELTAGGFAIAGFYDYSYDEMKLWLMRTDENYNHVWNRTYGGFPRGCIEYITEMNNGHLAIVSRAGINRTEQITVLIVDNEGEYVKKWVWSQDRQNDDYDYRLEFSYCSNGFILQSGEGNPEATSWIEGTSWIACLDADLNVIWNNTYPESYVTQHAIDDMAGGFALIMHREDGGLLVRLDSQGNVTSRVIIDSGGILGFGLTQCSSDEYLACNWAGIANNVVCFDTDGNILWEKGLFNGGGHCRGSGHQGIERLSADRYVSWDSCENGVYLDCFHADGTILWGRSFGTNLEELLVSDVISNSDGGVTILGVMPNMLVKLYDLQMLLVILAPIAIIGIITIAVVVLSPGWRKAYQAQHLAREGSRRASYEEWVLLTSSEGGKEQ